MRKALNFSKSLSALLFIALFFSLITLLIPKHVWAQTDKQKQLDEISEGFNKMFGDTKLIGINCGLVGGGKSAKCCNIDRKPNIEQQINSLFPDFLCLPDILSVPLNIGLAPLKAAGQAASGLVNIVTGDFEGGLHDLGCGATFGLIGGCSNNPTEPFCLSKIPKAFAVPIIKATPIRDLAYFKTLKDAKPCEEGAYPSIKDTKNPSCVCKRDPVGTKELCNRYIKTPGELRSCVNCNGLWTGVGCMGTNLTSFTGSLIGIGVGIAGGIAFLCILYSAILFQTSRGNPESIKKAREYMTNCIIGLILILFSVLILRIVGVDILGLPGFQ